MPTTYALLSTHPPTECGLATFSVALLDHLPEPGDQIAVVRVLGEPMPGFAGEGVHDLVNGSAASAAAAADVPVLAHPMPRQRMTPAGAAL